MDDIVAESFAKILSIMKDGGGPDVAFRAYLLTTVRHVCYSSTKRAQRVQLTDDMSQVDPGVPFVDTAVEGLEQTLIARAFARLPERWQTILWHTEVEGESPSLVGPRLGITANSVSVMAFRARERLRQHYLQEHIASDPAEECRWSVDQLGAYVRDGLSDRDKRRVDTHLTHCEACRPLFLELADVNASLRTILAPIVLAEAATAYLAATGKGIGFVLVFRKVIRRRSTQAAGAAVVVAAIVAAAMALTSAPVPNPAAEPPPEVQQPSSEPQPEPTPAPSPLPSPSETPEVPPPLAPIPTTLSARLEPVGELVRGRPGVLVMTVLNGTSGGTGGGFGLVSYTYPAPVAAESGPITAFITVPDGITLRAGAPGDGWTCTTVSGDFRCGHSSLTRGKSTRAYLPVQVAANAVDGPLTVRLTAPKAKASTATAPRGVKSGGLPAIVAGALPATAAVAGNGLLSCIDHLLNSCIDARTGQLTRDNGDFYMFRYADRNAPAGLPYGAMASGAQLTFSGSVIWAGLYWAGSGSPPSGASALIRGPGGGAYSKVKATKVDRLSSGQLGQSAYQAFADVTKLVRKGGKWWVGLDGHAFSYGTGSFGGWALVVLANNGGPIRCVSILDGFTALRDGSSLNVALYGGPGPAQAGFVAWEGDRGLGGDQIKLGGTSLGGDNIMSGHAAGTPEDWNTFGTDARLFSTRLSTQTLTLTTTRDAWALGPLILIAPCP